MTVYVFYYVLIVCAFLVAYVAYQHLTVLRWEEWERRRLEEVQLRLAYILRLLEAPDVRWMLEKRRTRGQLFLNLSESLHDDMRDLVRLGALRGTSLLWAGLFFLLYHPLRWKARILCGKNDLHLLSGLELAALRSLEE